MCSQCGRETTVPFKPTQGRPVYCRECFLSRKATGMAVGQIDRNSMPAGGRHPDPPAVFLFAGFFLP